MVQADLTVACVLWQGDFRKRAYSPEWVVKLASMCKKQLPPHNFVCLSNVEVPTHRIPLLTSWQGWWAKLELFRPNNGLSGRVLYLDLDVLLVKDCSDLVVDVTTFMPPSFTFGPGSPSSSFAYSNRYQSSCFCFEAGSLDHLYEEFSLGHMNKFRGDQDYIGWREPDFPTYPSKWFSKLRNCQEGPEADVKLVLSMPWKNDIAVEKFPWVREIWK